jgi:hypothetical protein
VAADSSSAKPKEAAKELEIAGLETPRDMLGDLNNLLSQLDEQPQWEPQYGVGEEVEARWTEDERWYTAVIDAVHTDIERYALTFTEYGNSQVTGEEDIKASLQRRLQETEAALAPAVAAERKKKKERRDSYIALHPELAETKKAVSPEESVEPKEAAPEEPKKTVSMEEALASGVLTPEQRKKMIFEMAQQMGAEGGRGTLVDVEKMREEQDPGVKEKALTERPISLKKDPSKHLLRQRARSNSVIELSGKNSVKGQAISGNADIEALLKEEQQKSRQRSESESAIKFAEEQQRKVWSDNNLLRHTKKILSENL